MAVELKIPEVGESVSEAQIGKWLKSEGDRVEKDEPIVELETDKVTVELPAPAAGTLGKILKQQGDMAAVGDVIGHIQEGDAPAGKSARPAEDSDQAGEAEQAKDTAGQAEQASQPSEQAQPAEQVEVQPRVMPAARRALAEHGLRAEQVEATGPGGRLLKEDVLRHVGKLEKQAAVDFDAELVQPAAPGAAGESAREEEIVPMSPIRRRIAQRLVQAQQTAALLTTFNECDMSAVMALRNEHKDAFEKRYGVKLGFMSFFVKAAVDALKLFPAVNAEVRDDKIVYRNHYDVGIAVSTQRGLVVPIIRHAEHLSFAEIEQTIGDFADRARSNKLKLEDLEGGTFTITNGGIFGSLLSTPIVNPPQSGVLGMHSIQKRPVAVGEQVVIKPMMYLALTYDHRIVDGREAVSFLKRIADVIENPSRMLIEI